MPKIIEDARGKILETAKRQLFARSYSEMTLRGVAAGCGIAVGTIYNYFPGKEDLVGAIMMEDWLEARAGMRRGCEGAASIQQGVGGIYNAIVRFSKPYAPVWADYALTGGTPSRYDERHLMLRRQIEEVVHPLLSRFGRRADAHLVPLLSETVLCAAVQKDIECPQLQEIIDRIFK